MASNYDLHSPRPHPVNYYNHIEKMLDLLFVIYYCEIIIDNGVLIFGCVVHLKHENKNPTKPRIQEPMDQWTFQKPRKLVPINKSIFTVTSNQNKDLFTQVVFPEANFIEALLKKNIKKNTRSFYFMFRYIDDVISSNNSKFCDCAVRIY